MIVLCCLNLYFVFSIVLARNATCKAPSPHKYVKYENEVFTLKTHQMFCAPITHEKFENATISGHFEFVFEECSDREITHYCNAIFFRKLTFQNSPSPRKAGVFKFLRWIVHGAYVINSFTFLRFQNVFQRFIPVHLTGVGTRDGLTGASEVICHAANRIQFSTSLARFRRLIHLLKTI